MELSNYLSHILDFKIPEGKNLTMLQAIGFKRFVLLFELDEDDNHIQSILS